VSSFPTILSLLTDAWFHLEQLLDLSNYKPEPADGTVVGWADHKRPKDNKMTEFRVSVKALKEKVIPSASEGVQKEEL
jgi:hypothetical protein